MRFSARTATEQFEEFAASLQSSASEDALPIRMGLFGDRYTDSPQEFRAVELGADTAPLTTIIKLRHELRYAILTGRTI